MEEVASNFLHKNCYIARQSTFLAIMIYDKTNLCRSDNILYIKNILYKMLVIYLRTTPC